MVKVLEAGNAERLKKVLKDIESKRIEVGIFEHSIYPDGTPIAYVAAIQEWGSPTNNIEPRPFFRPTIQEKKSEWGKQIAGAVQGAIDGKLNLHNAYVSIGGAAAGDVIKTLSRLSSPALKEETIRARKNDWDKKQRSGKNVSMIQGFGIEKPLVDEGGLIGAIESEVKG